MLFLTLVVVEICFRLYSSVSIIYDVEMHKYAKKLKQKSSIEGLSHEHIPNKEALLMGVKINLNDQGYREDVSSERKKNNEKRIVFVGSSITMGWGVEYDSVFTTKLEKYLKKNIDSNFNVLNTGVGNYNSNLESIFVLNTAVIFQIILGIITLLTGVKIYYASLHQLGSVLVLTSFIFIYYKNIN